MLRVPFEAVDLLRVPLHRVQLAEGPDIEHPNKAISACCCDKVALWVPIARIDNGFVRVSRVSQCAGPFPATHNVLMSLPDRGSQNLTSMSLLPETTKPLVGCQSTQRTSQPCPARQLYVSSIAGVKLTAQDRLLFRVPVAPDLHQPIITPRHKLLVVRAPGRAVACLPVPLEAVNVRQVRRKIFDHTEPVDREERLPVVRVRECADRVVMHLRDGLVVERCAVPKRELSFIVSGQ